jgi:mannose-6-phosphate isomerase-like protein (cupin superfamily)
MQDGELPHRVDKPWGHELWFAQTDRYAGKLLHVDSGQRLSIQYHEEKDETSYLLSGRLLLSQGGTRTHWRRLSCYPALSGAMSPGRCT